MVKAITLTHLNKVYGTLTAVKNFSLEVSRGTIFGLLGPNGAGKTTLIRILTTLIAPTSGSAEIEGHDVVADAKTVRSLIGVVPQENNLDRYLTARENLVLHAQMHGMRRDEYLRRVDEILDLTGLSSRQHEFPDTFSGGMQRRLVVGRALVHTPRVLFLDEPTTGLDPQSRRAVWEYIQGLKERMTIFLTTHYMEEAELLCDRVVIMDEGRSLVDGSVADLKDRLSHAHRYQVEFKRDADRYEALLSTQPFITGYQRSEATFYLTLAGEEALKPLMDCIAGNDLRRICLQEPTLEDVFIELTGKEVRE